MHRMMGVLKQFLEAPTHAISTKETDLLYDTVFFRDHQGAFEAMYIHVVT